MTADYLAIIAEVAVFGIIGIVLLALWWSGRRGSSHSQEPPEGR